MDGGAVAQFAGHGGDAVAAVGGQGFEQAEILEEDGVGLHDFGRGAAGIDAQQEGDEATDDGGIGGAGEDEFFTAAFGFHPDLGLAAGALVGVVGPFVGVGEELAAEFDDVLVAFHPVVEDFEFFGDRGDGGGGGGGVFGLEEGIQAGDVRAGGQDVRADKFNYEIVTI